MDRTSCQRVARSRRTSSIPESTSGGSSRLRLRCDTPPMPSCDAARTLMTLPRRLSKRTPSSATPAPASLASHSAFVFTADSTASEPKSDTDKMEPRSTGGGVPRGASAGTGEGARAPPDSSMTSPGSRSLAMGRRLCRKLAFVSGAKCRLRITSITHNRCHWLSIGTTGVFAEGCSWSPPSRTRRAAESKSHAAQVYGTAS
mmetsp:Transcript_75676/g.204609  ORF Transcript_75676/g.204609 Transcript_75676/m.204609 type:complete len:202 (+) Transcript_75676:289-894(+)